MLHTKRPATQKVLRMPLERLPQATRFWEEVSHYKLIQSVLCHTKNAGWKTVVTHLSNDRRDMAASLTVLGAPNYRLGILNSNAMHELLTFFVGPLIGEGEGVPLAKVVLGRHRRGFDLDKAVQSALDKARFASLTFANQMSRLRSESIDVIEAQQQLTSAGMAGLMPWSRIGRINESVKEEALGARISKERLLLAFANTARMNPPLKQMQQVYSFYLSLQEKDHGPDDRKLPGD